MAGRLRQECIFTSKQQLHVSTNSNLFITTYLYCLMPPPSPPMQHTPFTKCMLYTARPPASEKYTKFLYT